MSESIPSPWRIDGTPSYCYAAADGDDDPHAFEASLTLDAFYQGPITVAILVASCPEGDEVGIELSRGELRRLRDRIDAVIAYADLIGHTEDDES